MDFGITMFPADYALNPAVLAREVEARGFESLFFPEHSHIPVSRTSPYPGGGELPRMYSHTYDPFVSLMACAAATTTLKVGTGVCLVIQRDPIHTAKEVASIDQLSAGRFLFGVGAGWNREEMADHGTDPRVRMAVLVERVQAMQELWTKDEADFHGTYVDFGPTWAWPKPFQQPHPPVLVGGMGPGVIDRVLAVGGEWLPQNVTLDNIDEFAKRADELQRQAADAGRETVPMTLFAAEPDPKTIEAYAKVGITRCVFLVPDAGADVVLPKLDELAKLTQTQTH